MNLFNPAQYANISLKKKLLLTYILLTVIPLLMLGISTYYYVHKTLYEKLVLTSQNNNEQIVKNIDAFLSTLSKLSEFPSLDDRINSILRKNYEESDYSLVEMLSDVDRANASLYRGVLSMNDSIGSVTVIPNNMNYVFNVSVIAKNSLTYPSPKRNEPWYQRIEESAGKAVVFGVHRDYLQAAEGPFVISVGRSIVDPYTEKSYGITLVNVRAERMTSLWQDLAITPKSKFVVIDDQNHIIYGSGVHDMGSGSDEIPELAGIEMTSGSSERTLDGEDVYVNVAASSHSNWKVVSIIPKGELLKGIYKIRDITMLLSAILIVFAITISTWIATSITRPVLQLKRAMKRVEDGNLNVNLLNLPTMSHGEIGDLSNSFNKMIVEMKALIDEIYRQERAKRSAEIMALQSQISPHFLYNTLNTIKWMAKIQGSSGMVNALGSLVELLTFTFRNQGSYITIQEELEQLEYYLDIMNLRFFDKFMVNYEIDESVLQCQTLKFLLQPIVENAILHGMKEAVEQGIIQIRIMRQDDKILYTITDNGKGIDEDTIHSMLEAEDTDTHTKFNKVGLFNVNQRIKYEFGDSYGLEIKSKLGEYSTIHMIIPVVERKMGEEAG